ncbi:MAG: VanZ family protein [Bacteroidetes bacterium]|nr:VanZ family protein [Bacteroidota bacterium]
MEHLLKNAATVSKYLFWPVLLGILYLSFANNETIGKINTAEYGFRLDYIFHFLAYAALVILYRTGYPEKTTLQFLLSTGVIATLLLAILSEASQFYISWRTFNWWDLAMNAGGVATGLIISLLFKPKITPTAPSNT